MKIALLILILSSMAQADMSTRTVSAQDEDAEYSHRLFVRSNGLTNVWTCSNSNSHWDEKAKVWREFPMTKDSRYLCSMVLDVDWGPYTDANENFYNSVQDLAALADGHAEYGNEYCL